MTKKIEKTDKEVVISKKDESSRKYFMAKGEYTNIIVTGKQTNNEYVITDGVIEPDGFVPDHYHKWEDQTFHVLEGNLKAKIGDQWFDLDPGSAIHCPRGTSHYIKNIGTTPARLVSYIFPGDWAEEFFAETSKQNHEGNHDLELIKKKFGVVYL